MDSAEYRVAPPKLKGHAAWVMKLFTIWSCFCFDPIEDTTPEIPCTLYNALGSLLDTPTSWASLGADIVVARPCAAQFTYLDVNLRYGIDHAPTKRTYSVLSCCVGFVREIRPMQRSEKNTKRKEEKTARFPFLCMFGSNTR